MEYDVFIHVEILTRVPKTGSQRERIMRFIRRLQNDPWTSGDFIDRDSTLRERQVKIVGNFAITYWVDDPVKAVMVVDIRPADN